eukprot:2398245-Prorocentrum_lima.AAC.1
MALAVKYLRGIMESLGLKLAPHKTCLVSSATKVTLALSDKLGIPGKPKNMPDVLRSRPF